MSVKKEKEVTRNILFDITQLEAAISRLKLEVSGFSKKDAIRKKEIEATKRIIDQIIREYKRKLREKQDEIAENAVAAKEVIKEYEKKLSEKENMILMLNKRIDDKEGISSLKKKGVPSEIIMMPKEEVTLSFLEAKEECFRLKKIISGMESQIKRNEEQNRVSRRMLEKKIEVLSSQLSVSLEKNNVLQRESNVLKKELEILYNEAKKAKSFYAKKEEAIRNDYEAKLKGYISQRTSEQVDMEAENRTLKKELSQAAQMLKEKEELEKEIISDMQRKFLSGSRDFEPKRAEDESASDGESLMREVRDALSNGDTKEKIIYDMAKKGFSRSSVIRTIQNIKK